MGQTTENNNGKEKKMCYCSCVQPTLKLIRFGASWSLLCCCCVPFREVGLAFFLSDFLVAAASRPDPRLL